MAHDFAILTNSNSNSTPHPVLKKVRRNTAAGHKGNAVDGEKAHSPTSTRRPVSAHGNALSPPTAQTHPDKRYSTIPAMPTHDQLPNDSLRHLKVIHRLVPQFPVDSYDQVKYARHPAYDPPSRVREEHEPYKIFGYAFSASSFIEFSQKNGFHHSDYLKELLKLAGEKYMQPLHAPQMTLGSNPNSTLSHDASAGAGDDAGFEEDVLMLIGLPIGDNTSVEGLVKAKNREHIARLMGALQTEREPCWYTVSKWH